MGMFQAKTYTYCERTEEKTHTQQDQSGRFGNTANQRLNIDIRVVTLWSYLTHLLNMTRL